MSLTSPRLGDPSLAILEQVITPGVVADGFAVSMDIEGVRKTARMILLQSLSDYQFGL